ncbi:MAG: class I SAM-dependent methyltransferase [Roseobacter sp.]
MSDKKLTAQAAYALETVEERQALYAEWAMIYDDSFASAADYIFPRQVAQVFGDRGGTGPILDAGAGTGLVAQEILRTTDVVCDAVDLSGEMLAVAQNKQIYRHLIQADLNRPLPIADETYAAVVSAGTFTHGHVGPEALDELLRVAAIDALFVLTIKIELYKGIGFDVKFDELASKTKGFEVQEVPIYGAKADDSHAGDLGLVVSFRRA